jgi:hypothetical protein
MRVLDIIFFWRGRRGRDGMVVGFTTTCAIMVSCKEPFYILLFIANTMWLSKCLEADLLYYKIRVIFYDIVFAV